MIREYIQSEEDYKGFVLKITRTCLDERRLVYHRRCEVWSNGERIAIGKTKKEIKDLIDGGYMQKYEN